LGGTALRPTLQLLSSITPKSHHHHYHPRKTPGSLEEVMVSLPGGNAARGWHRVAAPSLPVSFLCVLVAGVDLFPSGSIAWTLSLGIVMQIVEPR